MLKVSEREWDMPKELLVVTQRIFKMQQKESALDYFYNTNNCILLANTFTCTSTHIHQRTKNRLRET